MPLSKELEEVKQLIDKNNSVKIEKVVDYNNCLDILQKFSILNNVFFQNLVITGQTYINNITMNWDTDEMFKESNKEKTFDDRLQELINSRIPPNQKNENKNYWLLLYLHWNSSNCNVDNDSSYSNST